VPQHNEVHGTGEFRRDILELVVPIAGGAMVVKHDVHSVVRTLSILPLLRLEVEREPGQHASFTDLGAEDEHASWSKLPRSTRGRHCGTLECDGLSPLSHLALNSRSLYGKGRSNDAQFVASPRNACVKKDLWVERVETVLRRERKCQVPSVSRRAQAPTGGRLRGREGRSLFSVQCNVERSNSFDPADGS
jgi:hypothetical protein